MHKVVTAAVTGTVMAGIGLMSAPASAATTIPTSVSLRAARTTVAPGGTDTLTAVLKANGKPLANRQLCLQTRPAGGKFGKCMPIKRTTNSRGRVTVTVTVSKTAGHKQQYEVFFNKNPRYKTSYQVSHSAIVTVTSAGPIPTSVSLRAARTTVAPGGTDTLTAVLKANGKPLANRQLCLQTRPAGGKFGKCMPIKRTTNSRGRVTVTVTVSKTAGHKQQYEVFFNKNPRYKTSYQVSHSAIVTITTS